MNNFLYKIDFFCYLKCECTFNDISDYLDYEAQEIIHYVQFFNLFVNKIQYLMRQMLNFLSYNKISLVKYCLTD